MECTRNKVHSILILQGQYGVYLDVLKRFGICMPLKDPMFGSWMWGYFFKSEQHSTSANVAVSVCQLLAEMVLATTPIHLALLLDTSFVSANK